MLRSIRLSVRSRPRVLATLGLALTLVWVAASPVLALDLFVNGTGDAGDNSQGDGECWTGGFVSSGMFLVRECTLRAAIEEANALAGADTVRFTGLLPVDPSNTTVIQLVAPLPPITETLTIDGTSAPTYDTANPGAVPVIMLNGSLLAGANDYGLLFFENADASQILALGIVRFPGDGIRLSGADLVRIDACHIGLLRGVFSAGNGGFGIHVLASSLQATVGQAFDPAAGFEGRGNVIASNGSGGVRLLGPDALLAGNKIGTDRFGNAVVTAGGAHGNSFWGVEVVGGAAHGVRVGGLDTLTGGTEVTAGNVIAGNASGGVQVDGTMTNVEIMANHIGIGADGFTALPNVAGPGVLVFADGVDIGAVGAGSNLISGHGMSGIELGEPSSLGPFDTRIVGNRIGTNAPADGLVANAMSGILGNADQRTEIRDNIIGGGDRAIDLRSFDNQIVSNFIGTNALGDDLGASTGIAVDGNANEIGGPGGLGNVIGHNAFGIRLLPTATSAIVAGNFVGTDAAGSDLGNSVGVLLQGAAHVVGGTLSGDENVIGHNSLHGLVVGEQADSAEVVGNYIGTDASGADLGNDGDGILLSAALRTTLGSDVGTPEVELPDRGNVIAFNGRAGIRAEESQVGSPDPTQNAWRGNVLYSNRRLPVDIGVEGANVNDPGDFDQGANRLQNTPELDAAASSYDAGTDTIEVRYRVDTDVFEASYPLTVDFYQLAPDGEEPFAWLGSHLYLFGSAGTDVTTSFTPAIVVPGSFLVKAIATDNAGNSSEVGNRILLPEPSALPALAAATALLVSLGRRGGRGARSLS
ncbi:MAG: hypothetical protein AAF430_19185 [Myxococcota bacterium]